MPIAQRFKALGAGNGFPFALPANYDTLLNNSFKSNNDAAFEATRFLVSDDIEREDAMYFYWNFAGFTTFNIGAHTDITTTFVSPEGTTVTEEQVSNSVSASAASRVSAIDRGDGSRGEDNSMGLSSPRFGRDTQRELNVLEPKDRTHLQFDQNHFELPFYRQEFGGKSSTSFYIFPCKKANGKFGLVYGLYNPGLFKGVNEGFSAFGSVITTNLTVKPALGESPAVTVPIQFQGIDYGDLVIGSKTVREKLSVTSASIVSDFYTYPEE